MNYVPCSACLAFLTKAHLWKHVKSCPKQQASPSHSTKAIPNQHSTKAIPHQHQSCPKQQASPSHSTKAIPHHDQSCPKQQVSPSHSTNPIPYQHQIASAAFLPFHANATDAFKTNSLQGMKDENCNVTLCIKCRYNIFSCSSKGSASRGTALHVKLFPRNMTKEIT